MMVRRLLHVHWQCMPAILTCYILNNYLNYICTIVNVELSKNVVLLHQKQRVLNLLEALLDRIYLEASEPEAADVAVVEISDQIGATSATDKERSPPPTLLEVSREVTTHTSTAEPPAFTVLPATAQAANVRVSEKTGQEKSNSSTAGQSPLAASTSEEVSKDLDDTLDLSGNHTSRITDNTASTSILLEGSDDDDPALVASLGSTDLPSVTLPTCRRSSSSEPRISSTERLREWQFQGGGKKVRSRESEIEHEDDEPLFRSSKKPRATENSVDTPSLQPPRYQPPNSSHNADSLPGHSISAGQTSPTDKQNGLELLMQARQAQSRRAGLVVEHTRIDEPAQSTLTTYVERSPNRDGPAASSPLARPSVIQQARPSTPIQNISQTPIDTRRRRQHTTLHHVENTLVETLNQNISQTVDVAHIRQKYRLHQARMTKFYRSPLGEYKTLCPKHTPAHTQVIKTLEQDLDIYASVNYQPSMGVVVSDVAVVNTNR